MSKIKLLVHTPVSVMLFNAMCESVSQDKLLEIYGLAATPDVVVDVKLTVNGVELDAERVLASCWEQLLVRYEQRVTQDAKAMVGGAGLQELADTFEEMKTRIENEFSSVQHIVEERIKKFTEI